MTITVPSTTADLPLAEVIVRLSRHPSLESILQIGSLATDSLTGASDYDLVIVLRAEELAAALRPWCVGITQIDHRLTDVIFVAAPEVERISALTRPVSAADPLAPVIRWVQNGTIVFDAHDLATIAKRRLASTVWIEPTDDRAAHATWFSINYNLAQTKRMAQADSPLYRLAAEIRMAVYGHTDLWHGYFTLRKLPWEGDKAAVAYLLTQDPAFLEAFRRFLAVSSVEAKIAAYEQAAAIATAAWGGLWPADVTAMNTRGALDVWQSLLYVSG